MLDPLQKPHWYGDKILSKGNCIWLYKHLVETLETFDKMLTCLYLSFEFLTFSYTGVTSADFKSEGKVKF